VPFYAAKWSFAPKRLSAQKLDSIDTVGIHMDCNCRGFGRRGEVKSTSWLNLSHIKAIEILVIMYPSV